MCKIQLTCERKCKVSHWQFMPVEFSFCWSDWGELIPEDNTSCNISCCYDVLWGMEGHTSQVTIANQMPGKNKSDEWKHLFFPLSVHPWEGTGPKFNRKMILCLHLVVIKLRSPLDSHQLDGAPVLKLK